MHDLGRLPRQALKMISELPHLVLEVTLSNGDELLIEVISLLVVVTLIVASSDRDSLGLLFWPPLATFGAPLCALTSCLEWRPSSTARGHLPIVMDENSPDRLLARGVPGGNVEQLLHGLWLIAAELMHQGSIVCARPFCQYDIGVADLGELVALSGETLDVIP
jgi:hypothetical protein